MGRIGQQFCWSNLLNFLLCSFPSVQFCWRWSPVRTRCRLEMLAGMNTSNYCPDLFGASLHSVESKFQ